MAPVTQIIDSRLGRSRSYMIATAFDVCGLSGNCLYSSFCCRRTQLLFSWLRNGAVLRDDQLILCQLDERHRHLGLLPRSLWSKYSTYHQSAGANTWQLGGTISPLIATNMVSHGVHWAYFYFITLAIAIVAFLSMGWSFLGFEDDAARQLRSSLQRTDSRQATTPNKKQVLRKAMRDRITLFGATIIL